MLGACHERVQRSLDLLGRLIEHVDAHGHDASSRSAAHDVLRYFTLAAPLHHQDEELHLFARLLSHGTADVVMHVERLQQEHREMEMLWHAIEPTLQVWSVAEGSARVTPEQRDTMARFRALYPPHIALEESIVFPAAFALLTEQEIVMAGADMRSRRRVGHNPQS